MTLSDLQLQLRASIPAGQSPNLVRDLSTLTRNPWPVLAPENSLSVAMPLAIGAITGSSPQQTTLLRAGLYLMHDFLDESHVQSQSMEGDPDADLWHAIMHRREPDHGNARYWYRRVGTHPIFSDLAAQAAPLLAAAGADGFSTEHWDAKLFVDLCERVERDTSPLNLTARHVQWIEMSLHLSHCLRGR